MKKRRKLYFICLIIAQLLLGACSVKQQVFIETDSSGSISMRVELGQAFVEYIKDMAELVGEPVEGAIFDVAEIEKQFPTEHNVELKRVQTPKPEILEMDIAFKNIGELFSGEDPLQEAGILSFRRDRQQCSLKLHLDCRNFSQISVLFPFLQNPLFEGLGPMENDDTTEEEYIELIELALGEEGAASLQSSYLDIHVKVRGKIISQSGGTLSGDGVTFRIPLIRVLLLDKPLDYSVVFR